MRPIADTFDRHRGLATAVIALLSLAAALGALRTGFDVNMRNLFRSDDGRMDVLEEIYRDFGTDDHDCIAIVSGAAPFDRGTLAAVHDLTENARAVEAVDAVFSVAAAVDGSGGALLPDDFGDAEAHARFVDDVRAHPLVNARLVSEDGRHFLVLMRLANDLDEEVLDYLRPDDNPIRAAVANVVLAPGVSIHLTGIPVVRVELLSALQWEQVRFVVISGFFGAVICLILFRRVMAALVVIVASGIGTLWLLGFMGLTGTAINPVNSVVPTIVLIVGFTDAVHMLHAVREQLSRGATPREASTAALASVGPACFLTSLTTAIGFISLAAARLDVIEQFGVTAAMGAVMSFLAVVLVVPLLTGTRLGHLCAIPPNRALGVRSAMERIAPIIVNRPAVWTGLGAAATLALALTAQHVYASAWLREGLPSRSPSYQGIATMDEEFGGLLTLLVRAEWSAELSIEDEVVLGALREVHEVLEGEPMLGAPLSILNVIELIPGPMPMRWAVLDRVPGEQVERVLRRDLHRAIVTVPIPDCGSHVQRAVLDRLRSELARIEAAHPGVELDLSGNPVAVGQSADLMIIDLLRSLFVAAGVIFGVMTIAFRSLRLGLIAVVPNLFPLLCAAAALVVVQHPLTVTAVITFCVCLGVAVDDTIHVLHRYGQALRAGESPRAAASHAIVTVGAALVTTTFVLVGGMGVVLLSELPMMRLFAGLACTAVSAALIGDLVVLPAALAWLGRRGRG